MPASHWLKSIARRDPERIEWRWDVSISLDRIGDVLLAKGKAGEALAAYRRGLEIAEEAARPIRPGPAGSAIWPSAITR